MPYRSLGSHEFARWKICKRGRESVLNVLKVELEGFFFVRSDERPTASLSSFSNDACFVFLNYDPYDVRGTATTSPWECTVDPPGGRCEKTKKRGTCFY